MNGRKATFARRFAWDNKNLTPAAFLVKVLELNERDQVKKKITHEYKVLRRQAGKPKVPLGQMPDSADPK